MSLMDEPLQMHIIRLYVKGERKHSVVMGHIPQLLEVLELPFPDGTRIACVESVRTIFDENFRQEGVRVDITAPGPEEKEEETPTKDRLRKLAIEGWETARLLAISAHKPASEKAADDALKELEP